MKERLIVIRDNNRIYLRDIDIRKIKGALNLAGITILKTEKYKYKGLPRQYIELTDLTKLITLLSSDYEIIFR